MKKIAFSFFVLLCCSTVQADAALVVATCGTTPTTYVAGQTREITVDTNGNVCS